MTPSAHFVHRWRKNDQVCQNVLKDVGEYCPSEIERVYGVSKQRNTEDARRTNFSLEQHITNLLQRYNQTLYLLLKLKREKLTLFREEPGAGDWLRVLWQSVRIWRTKTRNCLIPSRRDQTTPCPVFGHLVRTTRRAIWEIAHRCVFFGLN